MGATDVARLFDSIVRGYPIGSLLLWVRRSPAARITLGSLEINAPASDSALWVVDGQQRITSLANALHPDGNKHQPFNIAYDLKDEKKGFAPFRGAADPMVVPLPVLFDLDRLIKWFAVRRIFLRGVSPERSALPANHLFAPSESDPVDDLPTLLSRRPANIDEQRWDRVLTSYCLTRDSAELLAKGDTEAFLTARQQAITEQLHRFVNRMAEWDYEDTPPLDSLDLDAPEDGLDDAD